MPALPSIPDILTTADIREGLDIVSAAFNGSMKGGSVDPRRASLIDTVRRVVQHRYDLDPSDSTLRQTSNYLFSLVAPALTVNTNLGTIILHAVAVSTTEIDTTCTPVPNATQYILEHSTDNINWVTIYTGSALLFNDTGLTPSTLYYYKIHATAPGYIDSPYAFAQATTLTPVVTITVDYYYGDTDYFSALSAGTDAITYNGSLNITHNANINVPWGVGASNNKYLVLRVPIGESIKASWFNTSLNNGTIPDSVWRAALQPAGLPLYTYYVTRVQQSLDPTQSYIFS